MTDSRQEVRRIITATARAVDRRLAAEVREVPGQERLEVSLTHGTHHAHIEVAIRAVMAANEDAVARNELRLRLKRACDTMLFRPMPDHRISVKSIAPPGGQMGPPRGRGRR